MEVYIAGVREIILKCKASITENIPILPAKFTHGEQDLSSFEQRKNKKPIGSVKDMETYASIV